jgi:hypothetical protein
MSTQLPTPKLRHIFRIDATLDAPVDLVPVASGRRRIVPLSGGSFTGAELSGTLLAVGSADWQTVHEDGSSVGDVRMTLQTDAGAVLYVQSRAVRHGPPSVLARLARGEDVDPSEYTFRAATQIETTDGELEWLNQGIFIAVGGRQPAGVAYDVYVIE